MVGVSIDTCGVLGYFAIQGGHPSVLFDGREDVSHGLAW